MPRITTSPFTSMERSNGGYSILTDSHLWQVLDTNALESWTEAQPRFSSHVAHTVLKQLLFICAVLPRWKQCIYTPGCHSSKLREQQRERCFLTPQWRKLATLLLEYFSSSFPFFPHGACSTHSRAVWLPLWGRGSCCGGTCGGAGLLFLLWSRRRAHAAVAARD